MSSRSHIHRPLTWMRRAGYELDIEEDNMDDMPAEELEEAEREMSLEELIEELEATTRKIKSSDLLESTGNDLDKHL